ncbi:hypothetical protein [Mycobacterium palustre]|uniref:Uncharacterized protein n=1 Tax=Mycobacterium palustre TaxID=153971 RepID=A0A1X1ZFS2_9MYCO|nr:hypothetical protein [Mycobacterium palustre]MCV7101358.1 hypothetical protein [Mycobacterium palustre]ORW21981.1 hypothetical protein AWC19_13600 [Mycobacterium palustre]
MTDHDVVGQRHVRVALINGDNLWIDSTRQFIRVRGGDLRQVAQNAASAHEDHPGLDVLVDIDVLIDTSSARARHRMTVEHVIARVDTITYVGTPTGLVGLVADIHALGMCDGAVLRPLLPGVIDLIRERVMPELSAIRRDRPLSDQMWPA